MASAVANQRCDGQKLLRRSAGPARFSCHEICDRA